MKRLRTPAPASAGIENPEVVTVYQHYSEATVTHTPTGRRFLVEWVAGVDGGYVVYRVRRIREATRNWQELTSWDYRAWAGTRYSDPDLLLDAAEEVIVDTIRQEQLSPEAA